MKVYLALQKKQAVYNMVLGHLTALSYVWNCVAVVSRLGRCRTQHNDAQYYNKLVEHWGVAFYYLFLMSANKSKNYTLL